MKSSDTWNIGMNKKFNPSIVTLSVVYNKTLLSTFPTKKFKDFKPNKDLLLERAMIRYNDEDLMTDEDGILYRSLFNHPCSLYIDTRYLLGYDTNQKAHFCVNQMNLFSRLRLEYANLFQPKSTIGYFTSNNTCDYR